MNELTIPIDIAVRMQRATSFPDGVMQAHQALHEKLRPERRAVYGISHPGKDGNIMYWAAITELFEGELADKGLEPFTIVKGRYVYMDVTDFMNDPSSISSAFQYLLADKRIAPDGCCIEHYYNDTDCRCMVRIK